MKWSFFALCTLNIVMLVLLWSDSRALKNPDRYVMDRGAIELRLASTEEIGDESLGQLCTLVGPFESKVGLNEVQLNLRKAGYEIGLVEQELELAPAYWVYFSDYQEGVTPKQQLREFSSKGLDAFIILKGELKGFISLGVFKNIDSARRMIKIAAKKGYKANFDEIKREEEVYWLSVHAPYLAENKDKISEIMRVSKLSPEMRQIFCKSVASEK